MKPLIRTRLPKQEKSGIYIIRSKATDKIYVGRSLHIKGRIKGHLYNLNKGKDHNPLLYSHVSIYGMDDLVLGVIEFCPPEIIAKREQYWINKLNPEFNIRMNVGNNGICSNIQKDKEKFISNIQRVKNKFFRTLPRKTKTSEILYTHKEDIIKLLQKNIAFAEIGRMYEVDSQKVHNWIDKNNLRKYINKNEIRSCRPSGYLKKLHL